MNTRRVVLILVCLLLLAPVGSGATAVSGTDTSVVTSDTDSPSSTVRQHLSDSTAAQQSDRVTYDVTYDPTTEQAVITARITLVEPQAYSEWRLAWELPKNATILAANSTQGDVSVTRDGRMVQLREEDGPPRTSETFTLKYETQIRLTTPGARFGTAEFGFGSFSGASTRVSIAITNGTVLNVASDHGENVTVSADAITATDTGPLGFYANIKPAGSDPTATTEHYTVFETTNTTHFEAAYSTAVAITGHEGTQRTIPVAVIDPARYERYFGTASTGHYTNGAIYLKADANRNRYVALAHETVHALNHDLVGATPDWFDEGTAQLAERIIINRTTDARVRFANVDRLQQYNANNETWVYETKWNASNDFAYDYAEIRLKQYVRDHGIRALWDAYDALMRANASQFNTSELARITGIEPKYMCTGPDPGQCANDLIAYTPNATLPPGYEGAALPEKSVKERTEPDATRTETSDETSESGEAPPPETALEEILDAIRTLIDQLLRNLL